MVMADEKWNAGRSGTSTSPAPSNQPATVPPSLLQATLTFRPSAPWPETSVTVDASQAMSKRQAATGTGSPPPIGGVTGGAGGGLVGGATGGLVGVGSGGVSGAGSGGAAGGPGGPGG